jgi:hypothetical protein
MNAMTNMKEAKSYKESEPFSKTSAAEGVPESTRLSIREAVDILLEAAHDLEDRAAAKGDMYLCRAVGNAIDQVHKAADVLESLKYQLTEAA